MQIQGVNDSRATPAMGSPGAAGAPPRRPESGGEERGRTQGSGPRGGGLMVQAMKETLSQLGLQANGSMDGSVDGDATLREDMHALMHALFHALHAARAGEASSDTGEADGSGTQRQSGSRRPAGPPPELSSALSTLGTQAAQGQAPTELQDAFDQLVQGLATGTGGGGATLSSFLQTLSQNLGPAVTPQMPSTGQSLQLQA